MRLFHSRQRSVAELVAKSAAFVSVITVLLCGQPASAQTDPLGLANNYFVTGDYVVGGVGLRGLGVNGYATGTINIPDPVQPNATAVPEGADIVEAFLYWQTVESSQSSFAGQQGFFNGYPITGVVLGNPNAPVSWSSGGCSGSSNGAKTMRTYRAGVRPYLKVDSKGVVLANGSYVVSLVDSGSSGGGAPLTLGATLVIIYRVLSPTVPLSSVVLYDGAFAPSNASDTMSQTILGFYQPAANPVAKITHIVGNGQANKSQQVYLNGSLLSSLYQNQPPFPGKYNGSWDNPTWDVSQLLNAPPNQESETTSVVPSPSNGGCVSWGAVLFKTTAQDSDHDGLLDMWESAQGYTDVKDGSFVALPGASPNQRDIYVQLDYMCSIVNPNGTCDTTSGHSHLPLQQALTMTTNSFAAKGVNLHFDVKNAIQEEACSDDLASSPPKLCPYPNQEGVVSWRAGFTFLKNQPLNYPDEATCQANSNCTRRFQHGRKDSYHYAISGHSSGLADWSSQGGTLTSVAVSGASAPYTATFTTSTPHSLVSGNRVTVADAISNINLNGTYFVQSVTATTFSIQILGGPAGIYTQATDPNLSVSDDEAGTVSGMSDVGGQDSLMTLGGWGPDGETLPVQAGTLMHELGHSIALTHGGFYFDTPDSYVPTVEPNCKSNFQSVMNYMFQVDLVGPNGALDFSGQQLDTLNEAGLTGVPGVTIAGGTPTYSTTKWYSPIAPNGVGTAATHHCDGTPLLATDPPMYRLEGPTTPITWFNGWDINFDGLQNNGTGSATFLRGYNDWGNVDLRQIGATGSTTVAGGVLYGGSGGVLYGGSGGVLYGGSGGVLYGGSGGVLYGGSGGVLYGGSGGESHGEITHQVANSVVRPPRNLTAILTTSSFVQLNWTASSFGQTYAYRIYRSVNGAPFGSSPYATVTAPVTTYTDQNVASCTTYTYIATAVLADGRESVSSNAVSKTLPCIFIGFQSPLATAGETSYSGQLALSKGVAIKWQLTDLNGTYISTLNLNTLGKRFTGQPTANGKCPLPNVVPLGLDQPPLYSPASGANGGTFEYDTKKNQFVFTWNTATASAGCYVIELDLADGQVKRTSLKLQ